jgi:hypothetical protein
LNEEPTGLREGVGLRYDVVIKPYNKSYVQFGVFGQGNL